MSNNNGKKSTSFGEWTLKDLLMWMKENSAKFYIPDYQRGYAWGERQLTDFWDDLLSPTKKHYTGAITVEEVQDNFSGHYDVVDGQQRLTTIAVLFSILNKDSLLCSRLMYGENNESREYFIELLRSNAFNSRAVENGKFEYLAPDTLKNPKNVYQRNLIKAKVFFLKKTSEMGEKEKCDLFDKTLAKLTFDFRILGGDFNSGIVFETMNNRGKPLTLLEKLKNRLIYLSDNLSNPNDKNGGSEPLGPSNLRDAINTAWGKIYKELASDPKREPLDEDEFVASHLSVYRNPKESVYSESVAESRLFKMFCAHPEHYPKSEDVDENNKKSMAKAVKEEELTSQKIGDYVKDLEEFASAWSAIHKQFDSACGHCRLLSGTREVKTFLAAAWLLATDPNSQPENHDVFKNAEKLLFRNTILNFIDEALFATLGRRLHGKCLDQIKTKGDAEAKIDISGSNDILKNALLNAKRNIDANKLVRVFSDRMDRQQWPYGFYGWSGLKYFLFTQETGDHRLSWDKFGETSLEHVIPQSATEIDKGRCKNGWWDRQVSDYAPFPAANSAEEQTKDCRCRRRKLVNSLGNFVLLSQSENASVSDGPWESYKEVPGVHKEVIGKKAFYADPKHASSFGARCVARVEGSWNAFQIRERGRGLFRKLSNMLGVTDGLDDKSIDCALGFPNAELLEDRSFDKLSEDDVKDLAPKFGTASEEQRHLTNKSKLEYLKALERAFEEQHVDGRIKNGNQLFPKVNKKLYFEIKDDQIRLILSCQNRNRRHEIWTEHEAAFRAMFQGNMVEIDPEFENNPQRDGRKFIRFKYLEFPDVKDDKLLKTLVNNYNKVNGLLNPQRK